jgi:hypothetical protein
MVGYDLNKSGKNYDGLIEKIKQISSDWWHQLDSTWLIVHGGTSINVRDALNPYIDKDDELLVVQLMKGDAAWAGFNKLGSDWLMRNLSK